MEGRRNRSHSFPISKKTQALPRLCFRLRRALSNRVLENGRRERPWKFEQLKLRVEGKATTVLDPKLMKDLEAERRLSGDSGQI